MKRTPLYDVYSAYEGVKIIEFGGWELPVNFKAGIISEHNAVRNGAGMFDVSHMGEIIVSGQGSGEYVNWLVTNDLSHLGVGEVIYSPMCYPDGSVVDDLIVYRLDNDVYFLVVNASNTDKDYDWIASENPAASSGKLPGSVTVENVSANYCQIAVQGPDAEKIISSLYPAAGAIGFFTFHKDAEIAGCRVILSRTGYTGEDGFEIYGAAESAPTIWNAVMEAGKPYNLLPCGLGARDTLRLEAKLPLYGHEISAEISPLEANLSYFVNLDAGDFCGRDALLKEKEAGIPRTLRGIKMIDKGVARQGYPVYLAGENQVAGMVTSGAKSPVLDEFIGLVLIKRGTGLKIGDTLEIEIHGKRKKAELVKTPFYKKKYVQSGQ